MAQLLEQQQGYFSVLRWRVDAARDEARNVAVILVDQMGKVGGIKAAPLSAISPRLEEQGLLDGMLFGLEKQFAAEVKPDLEFLLKMRQSLYHSIYITEPQNVAVSDVDTVLNVLYRAYVAPRGGPRELTKGVLLDRVTQRLRRMRLEARRGEYVDDFLFDVTVRVPQRRLLVFAVLSFALRRQDWAPVEKDAAHFLYARGRIQAVGHAVIQPPGVASHPNARQSYERVQRWFEHEQVKAVEVDALPTLFGLL